MDSNSPTHTQLIHTHIKFPQWRNIRIAFVLPLVMPALQLFSLSVPKHRPFYATLCAQNLFSSPNCSLRMSSSTPRCSSLASVAPLEAILFDIDGTLADSDPIHYYAFREMLQELGFNGGEPISEEFFINNISGKHNEELCGVLFPDWDLGRARKFFVDKEAMFRRLAAEQTEPVAGLDMLCRWVEDKGLRRAAVTNAPRANAEMLISLLGLDKFFELLVIGNECERPKPFPDPYLTALRELGVSADHSFVFEDSVSGIKAGMSAGMPVVGLALRNPESLLTEAGAAMVIKDYTETKLWTVLENIAKKREESKVIT